MFQVTQDGPKSSTPTSSTLRPVKDVLNRPRFDDKYDLNDFVIGYVERHAGIIEIPVAEWKNQESQDCVVYFKNVKEDAVVWDRVSKTDLFFS